MDETPDLHIYAQLMYHWEAIVVGNVAGLTAMRDALNAAIDRGTGCAVAFAKDGEGYHVVALREDNMRDMPVPYTDRNCSEPMTMELATRAANVIADREV